jgi:hypothetical protein
VGKGYVPGNFRSSYYQLPSTSERIINQTIMSSESVEKKDAEQDVVMGDSQEAKETVEQESLVLDGKSIIEY